MTIKRNFIVAGLLLAGLALAGCAALSFSKPPRPQEPPCPPNDEPATHLPEFTRDASQPPERSLLTGEPCGPPCWQGIVPGETSLEDGAVMLANIPHIYADDTSDWDGFDRQYWLYGDAEATPLPFPQYNTGPRTYGNLAASGGVIEFIHVPLEYETTLGDLIEIYGEPGGYFVVSGGTPDSVCVRFNLYFVWPEHGLTMSMWFVHRGYIPESRPVLAPDQMVALEVYYTRPFDDTAELFEITGEFYFRGVDMRECCYHEWAGIDDVMPSYMPIRPIII